MAKMRRLYERTVLDNSALTAARNTAPLPAPAIIATVDGSKVESG